MSVSMRDRTAGPPETLATTYKNHASPRGKVVVASANARHRLLSSMMPQLTPRSERLLDHLMSLTDDEFAVLCHHDGNRRCVSMSKLDIIGDALAAAADRGETVELDLTGLDVDAPLDELDGPTDADMQRLETSTADLIADARLRRAG